MSEPDDGLAGPPAARDIARTVFGAGFAVADRYAERLASVGIEWGLLGPREASRIWDRHILNSVAVASLLPVGVSVVDLGSGAGLPGIPLAILRPDLDVTLLEPLLRRSRFLEETVADLSLELRVVRARAEDWVGRCDRVVARAVAPLEKLIDWSLPLLERDGVLLALKGERGAAELATVQPKLRKLHLSGDIEYVRAAPEAEVTSVVSVRRS